MDFLGDIRCLVILLLFISRQGLFIALSIELFLIYSKRVFMFESKVEKGENKGSFLSEFTLEVSIFMTSG